MGNYAFNGLYAACIVIFTISISACGTHDPRNETVRSAVIDGPFTFQDVNYRQGGNYFTSVNINYIRILYKGKVFVNEFSGGWYQKIEGVGESAWLLVGIADGNRETFDTPHVLYEKEGKPVMKPLPYCRDIQLPFSPKDFLGRCLRYDAGREILEIR